MSKTIQHTGIIEKIEQPVVFVRIVQPSACNGCHAASVCPNTDGKNQVIEVEDHTGHYTVNEEVMLCGQYTMGRQAILLAYVYPMLLVVAALAIGVHLTGNEPAGGLTGLLILFPYYGLIYLMRDRLKRKFVFTLSQIIKCI
ncbi:MAG: SoxR reducing system RseC family protein [Tannerella sp.]|jgi:sigma-E factor negative regulatory protein RseC|nr:SoxR reducing system RseC family protein [Tannerella sp.]